MLHESSIFEHTAVGCLDRLLGAVQGIETRNQQGRILKKRLDAFPDAEIAEGKAKIQAALATIRVEQALDTASFDLQVRFLGEALAVVVRTKS